MQLSPHLVREKDRHVKALKKLMRRNEDISFLAFHIRSLPEHYIVDMSGGLTIAMNNAGLVVPSDDKDETKSKQLRQSVLPETAMTTDAVWLLMGLPMVVSLKPPLNDIYRNEETHWVNVFFKNGSVALTMFDNRGPPVSDGVDPPDHSLHVVQQKRHQFDGLIRSLKQIGDETSPEHLVHCPLLNALIQTAKDENTAPPQSAAADQIVPPGESFNFLMAAVKRVPDSTRVCPTANSPQPVQMSWMCSGGRGKYSIVQNMEITENQPGNSQRLVVFESIEQKDGHF